MRGNFLFKLLDKYIGIPVCMFLSLFNVKSASYKDRNIKNILIIKLSAMGDTILLVPLIRAIKEKFPESRISMVVTSINKNVAENCAYLDELIPFDPMKCLSNPLSLIRFLSKLRSYKYNLAVDADQWLRTSALISFFSGAPVRIGFKTKSQIKHLLFTQAVPHERSRHEIECFLDLSRPLGIEPKNKNLEYRVTKETTMLADNLLNDIGIGQSEKFVILHAEVPEHAEQRLWPDEYFSALTTGIVKKRETRVILTGTVRVKDRLEKIRDACINELTETEAAKIHILTGLSIELLAGVLKKSSLVVCCNTGLMHLACAVGAAVVGLHGPTDPVKWGPVGEKTKTVKSGKECSPCLYLGFEYKCKKNECMKCISPEDVLKTIDF